jgi:16S rRNA (guanine527-N7)-methyltransferase
MTGSDFGARAFQAETGVSRETLERLETFEALLRDWQTKLNLVAASTLDDVWHRHFYDSAQIEPLAPPGASKWLDFGSGAGFPGLVIAILRRDTPDFEMHLTERLARKCDFLRAVAEAVGVPVKVHHGKIENLQPIQADIVSARACAPLQQLLEFYQRHAAPGAIGLFAKGRSLPEELTQANRTWRLDYDSQPSRTSSEGQILRVRSAVRA